MSLIAPAGTLNTTALVVPDLYVSIQAPTPISLNGVPSNTLGIVGTAAWGPIDTPVVIGSAGQYVQAFGPIQARKYDLGTPVAIATQQGANNFVAVRRTDGSDTAATINFILNTGATAWGLTVTALYTGTVGNGITISIATSAKGTGFVDATVTCPALGVSELFSAIPNTSTFQFWPALAAAINGQPVSGWSGRGASALISAAPGTNSGTIIVLASATATLSGGTDGASGMTGAMLLGNDGLTRTGMYALRAQGCSVAMLADCDTSATWTTQAAFGLGEGIYMVTCSPAGDTIANAVTTKQTAGLDSYAVKHMLGDWCYWLDQTNNVTRLVSPQAFIAGRLANLSPQNSTLNKPIQAIVSTQRSSASTGSTSSSGTYSPAELQALVGAGIDVICNPAPGGSYFAARVGHNSSSNQSLSGDNYTRMTNYLAQTLAAGMGVDVGAVINATLFANIRSTLLGYLGNLLGQGVLGSTDGSIPYAVKCDAGNNPQSRTSLGYVQADVQVQYQGINEKFIVKLQGGVGVQVSLASQQATALGGVAAA